VCGLKSCRCERRSDEAPLGCSRTWKEGIPHPFLCAHLGRVRPKLPVGVSKYGVYVGVPFLGKYEADWLRREIQGRERQVVNKT